MVRNWNGDEHWDGVFKEVLKTLKEEGVLKGSATVDDLMGLYEHYFDVVRQMVETWFFPKWYLPGIGNMFVEEHGPILIINKILKRVYFKNCKRPAIIVYINRLYDGYMRTAFKQRLYYVKNRSETEEYRSREDWSKEVVLGRGKSELSPNLLKKWRDVDEERRIDFERLDIKLRHGYGSCKFLH